VVLIPIPNSKTAPEVKAAMLAKVEELSKQLAAAGVKVATDTRDNYTPGWKYNHWELKGLPVRLELGARDMEGSVVVAARRDTGAGSGCGPWGAFLMARNARCESGDATCRRKCCRRVNLG
jgi:prolyl-tRNA synthetase